jgi:glycosyltransferase involved in cell wall biosynthesis
VRHLARGIVTTRFDERFARCLVCSVGICPVLESGVNVRLLHVVPMFHPATVYGGPSVVAAQQARSLAARGNHVTVAATNVMELRPRRFLRRLTAELDGVQVLYFPSRALHPPGYRSSRFPFIVSQKLLKWLENDVKSFDAVHVHFAREWVPVRAAQTSINSQVPTFLQPHGMLGRGGGVRDLIDRLWVKRTLEGATAVFALQQHESDEIKRITQRARTVELPNGIDLPVTPEIWQEGNLADPVVLFLARLHPRKRVSAFLEMARILSDRGVEARYRVVGPDGGDLAEAQRLVRRYELGDRVAFVGSLQGDAIAREYRNSAVYVLPSVNEPFPMTVLEALSLGVPTVVTDTCFIAPVLENSGGALVSGPQPEVLAESVEAILREPGLAERLSCTGRRLAQTQFSLDRVADRLENYYRSAHARAD